VNFLIVIRSYEVTKSIFQIANYQIQIW